MNFYLGTIALSIVFQLIAQIKGAIYKSNNPEDINYLDIGKYNVLNKKFLRIGLLVVIGTNLLILFIPVVNVLLYGYTLCKAGHTLNQRVNNGKVMVSPQSLMKIYENQASIEDALRIDGLSEEEIINEVKLANQESGHEYITDRMYEDIKASQSAIEYLNEFEQNEDLNLTRKDKIKLLREYRKAFTSGSKETLKPIEKTLKLANRQ